MPMSWLNRLPGSTPSAPGLEWWICKRLPALLLWGTAIPMAVAAVAWFATPDLPGGAEDAALWLMIYRLIGLVILHWSLMLTLAIGCAIVIVMKGPGYVADAYPLDRADGHR